MGDEQKPYTTRKVGTSRPGIARHDEYDVVLANGTKVEVSVGNLTELMEYYSKRRRE